METHPTIYPNPDFDAEAAATKLKDAMDGLGTNEGDIIEVLANHSAEQRDAIAEFYKQSYGADLVGDLKSELSSDFEQAVLALLAKPRVFDARELHRAIAGGGTDEECLIEILVSRSNDEIAQIKEEYTKEFESSLEEDIEGDTSGNFKRFLVSLSTGNREEDTWEIDEEKADADAENIIEAGDNQFGTDESEFNKVLCTRSRLQLLGMFNAYASKTGKTIEEALEGEVSGTLFDGYSAIVQHARSPAGYFAARLHAAMSGAGTTDDTVIRIIASRSEVDLYDIANVYSVTYGKSLEEAVSDDIGGDYRKLMVSIIKGRPE